MHSLDVNTGKKIGDYAHIKQSIIDILTTRVGTRIARREYGSYVPILLDSAMNDAGILRLKAAIVSAITRFEPRIEITAVEISFGSEHGAFVLALSASYRGELINWRDIII